MSKANWQGVGRRKGEEWGKNCKKEREERENRESAGKERATQATKRKSKTKRICFLFAMRVGKIHFKQLNL